MGTKIPQSVELNSQADQPALQRVVDYTSQSNGGFRLIQLGYTTLKIVNQIKADTGGNPVFPEFTSNLGITKNVLVIPYLPAVTNNAIKAWADLNKKESQPSESHSRKVAVVFRNTSEAIGMYGYFSVLVIQNPTFRQIVQPIASTFDLINDATDVGIRASDVVQCSKLAKAAEQSALEETPEKRATEEVKQSISDTKTYSIIRLVKAVSGAVSGILGLALLATGFALVPAIALLALSLITCASAISSQFYEESRKYSLIKL